MESKNYHEDLSHIRSMMERSSRFISLSGLSGVVAGLAAIIGATYVYFVFKEKASAILMEKGIFWTGSGQRTGMDWDRYFSYCDSQRIYFYRQ
jgi:hypothetical protein